MEQADPLVAPLRRRTLSDLAPRVLSGLVLAAIAIGLDFAGRLPFALLVSGLAIVMCWEWGRLVRRQESDAAMIVHAGAVLVAIALTMAGFAALGCLALCAGAIAVVPLRLGDRAHLSAAGVLYVGLPAVALVWIRSDEPYGALAIMLLFLTVWCMDTGAYLTGRTLGGVRLWPSVSPNKTWSGLAGGMTAAAIAGGVFGLSVPGASPLALALLAAGLGVIAQFGDLAESALKRRYGVKDVSHLIPGHGGFMDRLDGLVSVAAVAGLLALVLNVTAPASALIFLGS
jgi:phosphatidate cytidylyltransferase